MEIVATPIPEIEGGTDVRYVRIDVDTPHDGCAGKAIPGYEAHALALQMLQAAAVLLRADNAGHDIDTELEPTIGALEALIEEGQS